jgi:hypothetical protein
LSGGSDGESEIEGGERGYDRGFCAEDEFAQRSVLEMGGAGGGEFVFRPAALGTYG